MKVSVIIAARNAAATLNETLDSLREQTHSDWEAILVDDGSTDDTAAIAGRFAQGDSRLRVVPGPAHGVSEARNLGLQEASSDWVLFLDADDWILPTHLEKLTGVLAADPSLDGAYCGYARVAKDGTVWGDTFWWEPTDLFQQFAWTCIWTVHALVIRRALLLEVGGFLPGWKTCEDWDLWQRVARTGANFGVVRETLAWYRMSPGSASLDVSDMIRGARAVIERGHSNDPRVKNPLPKYENGMPVERMASARLDSVVWAAGILIGRGGDGRDVLKEVGDDQDPAMKPWAVASALFTSILLPSCDAPSAWLDLMAKHRDRIQEFLEALEEHSGSPFLSRRAFVFLEQLIVDSTPPRESGQVGRVQFTRVDLENGIADVRTKPEVRRLTAYVFLEGESLGILNLPVCDGFVPAEVLADQVASVLGWKLLDRHFARTRGPGVVSAVRGLVSHLGTMFPKQRSDLEAWALTSVHWVGVVKQLFGGGKSGGTRTNVGATIDLDIVEALPSVRTAEPVLHVKTSFAGEPMGVVAVPVQGGVARRGAIRRAILDACGAELVTLAVREGLIPDLAAPLRASLGARAARRREHASAVAAAGHTDAPEFPTLQLGRVPANLIGTSASRRAVLPSAAADALTDAASGANEPVRPPMADALPERVRYVPDLIAPAGPTGYDLPVVDVAGRGRRVNDITRRFLERAMPGQRRRAGNDAIADRLPILMLHRIASTGPNHLAPYRAPAEYFEALLAHLRERDYRSVTLDEWRAAKDRRRQLRGRPILLTFDDGYQDFADLAWPLLCKYGFSATVFLVSDHVGGTNAWDAAFGEEVPLMDWDTIRRLETEGVEFGAHTASHPPLSALDPVEIVREGARCRTVLERELGHPVRSIAYPFGDHDAAVCQLLGACGYVYGLTCREDLSRYWDSLLELPRFNVDPAIPVEHLVGRLEQRWGPGGAPLTDPKNT